MCRLENKDLWEHGLTSFTKLDKCFHFVRGFLSVDCGVGQLRVMIHLCKHTVQILLIEHTPQNCQKKWRIFLEDRCVTFEVLPETAPLAAKDFRKIGEQNQKEDLPHDWSWETFSEISEYTYPTDQNISDFQSDSLEFLCEAFELGLEFTLGQETRRGKPLSFYD